MQILDRKSFSPVHLEPGDKLQTVLTLSTGEKRVLCEHLATEAMDIDESVLFTLSDDMLDMLDWMPGAVGGAFGKKR